MRAIHKLSVESGRYSAEEVTAAVDELRDELEGHLQPLH